MATKLCANHLVEVDCLLKEAVKIIGVVKTGAIYPFPDSQLPNEKLVIPAYAKEKTYKEAK